MDHVIRAGAIVAVVLLSGCSSPPALPPPAPPARLDRLVAEQVAIRADEAVEAAVANLDSTRLALFFSGRALKALVDQVGWLRARGLRSEATNAHRAVASWDGDANEVVIQVEALQRLVSRSEPDPPWSHSTRQWWSRLGFSSGVWRVVDDRDLPPDQWRALTAWVPIADGPT